MLRLLIAIEALAYSKISKIVSKQYVLAFWSTVAIRLSDLVSSCGCDVPAHTYTWTFEPKPDWSVVYAGGQEIYDYFNKFSDKYHLRHYVKTKHLVSGAPWNAGRGGWDVKVDDLDGGRSFFDSCDILVNASGILNAWRRPAIPGLETFKGPLLHSGDWDESIDLRNKTVDLIGNG